MMQQIMTFLRNQLRPNWKIMVVLAAASGKEAFYKNFGFTERPEGHMGAGMSQWISSSTKTL